MHVRFYFIGIMALLYCLTAASSLEVGYSFLVASRVLLSMIVAQQLVAILVLTVFALTGRHILNVVSLSLYALFMLKLTFVDL